METLLETFDELGENSTLRLRLLFSILGTLTPGILHNLGLYSLGELGESASIKRIESALRGKNKELRELAVQILGKVAQKAPISLLLACLADSNREVRHVAIDILKKTHPETLLSVEPEAVAVLLDQEPTGILGSIVQRAFVNFVGERKSPSPHLLASLKECLSWMHWEVRMEAARTLGEIHRNIPDDIIKQLDKLQRDPESEAVREAASEALAKILSFESLEDS